MGAGALVAASVAVPAQARSLTTTPEATMHEQQKLGPDVVTTQTRNGLIVERMGSHRMNGAVYGYEPGYAPSYGWGANYGGSAYGYGYGHSRGYDHYSYAPGFGLSVGFY